jgi:hypothetical protein
LMQKQLRAQFRLGISLNIFTINHKFIIIERE